MKSDRPMVASHPGKRLHRELKARGWTQKKLASLCFLGAHEISDIIRGQRSITPRLASRIGAALGTGSELWIYLQNAYDLYEISKNENEQVVINDILTKTGQLLPA